MQKETFLVVRVHRGNRRDGKFFKFYCADGSQSEITPDSKTKSGPSLAYIRHFWLNSATVLHIIRLSSGWSLANQKKQKSNCICLAMA